MGTHSLRQWWQRRRDRMTQPMQLRLTTVGGNDGLSLENNDVTVNAACAGGRKEVEKRRRQRRMQRKEGERGGRRTTGQREKMVTRREEG